MLQHERDTWTDLCAEKSLGNHPGDSRTSRNQLRGKTACSGRAGGRVLAWHLDVLDDVAGKTLWWQFQLLSCCQPLIKSI